jgi:hypothetical protein
MIETSLADNFYVQYFAPQIGRFFIVGNERLQYTEIMFAAIYKLNSAAGCPLGIA